MGDEDCVRFLQWALPRLRMRWAGFRKVRRQVCRRIARRMEEVGCADVDGYRAHLARREEEWRVLDGCAASPSPASIPRPRSLNHGVKRPVPHLASTRLFRKRLQGLCEKLFFHPIYEGAGTQVPFLVMSGNFGVVEWVGTGGSSPKRR